MFHQYIRCVNVFWALLYKKYIVKLEQVQQTAIKMFRGRNHIPCEERIKDIGLASLEKKWLLGQVPQTADPNREMNQYSPQWCTMQWCTMQDIMVIAWNKSFRLAKAFFWWGCSDSRIGSPKKICSFSPSSEVFKTWLDKVLTHPDPTSHWPCAVA